MDPERPADTLTLRVVAEADVDADLDAAIRDCLVECFPDDREAFGRLRWWHSRPAWTVLAQTPDAPGAPGRGAVAGHLAMIERRVLVGAAAAAVRVAGVQSFAVRPAWRASGLAWRVMAAAVAEARRRGLDSGLLFCVPRLEKLYQRLGWRTIDAALWMRDAAGSREPIPGKNIAMIRPLNLETFPEGDVDLDGPDW